jgi:hypothetical protein
MIKNSVYIPFYLISSQSNTYGFPEPGTVHLQQIESRGRRE